MITVRTKSSQSVKDVVRFFNRSFPEAMLKVGGPRQGRGAGAVGEGRCQRPLTSTPAGAAPHKSAVPAQVGAHLAGPGVQQDGAGVWRAGHRGLLGQPDHTRQRECPEGTAHHTYPSAHLPCPPPPSTSPSPYPRPAPSPHACPTHQVFVNFAKKQSDNLEQQETEPPSALQSPLGCLLSLLRPRPAPTELRALVADEPEDLDTEDEGLISFEEERVSRLPSRLPRALPTPPRLPGGFSPG